MAALALSATMSLKSTRTGLGTISSTVYSTASGPRQSTHYPRNRASNATIPRWLAARSTVAFSLESPRKYQSLQVTGTTVALIASGTPYICQQLNQILIDRFTPTLL